jgi:hypothetical protein
MLSPLLALAPSVALLAFSPSSAHQEERWTQAELEALSAEISADLEELRDETFSRPVTVKVSSKDDLLAYIEMREAKTVPPEQLAADETIAKLLGVVPADMDVRARWYAMLESQVGGFYDPDTDSFSLMETLPRGLTKIVLAHELGHALDDQLFDIDGTLERLGDDTDATLAYHAVVEGSGTAVMTQWMLNAKESIDLASITASEMEKMTSMAGAPDWLWKPMMASYTVGNAFLAKTESWMSAGAKPLDPAALRTAFEAPPRSTEQVLHPDKYWDPEQLDEPRAVTFDTAKLAAGWKVLRADTLGEVPLAIVTTPPSQRDATDFTNPLAMLGIRFTNDAAAGWDGDRLVLLGKDDARVLRWVLVFDSERDAGELYGALQQQLPHLEAAAAALAGADGEGGESGVSVEYGEQRDVVVLTAHVGTGRGELKRVLRGLAHAIE